CGKDTHSHELGTRGTPEEMECGRKRNKRAESEGNRRGVPRLDARPCVDRRGLQVPDRPRGGREMRDGRTGCSRTRGTALLGSGRNRCWEEDRDYPQGHGGERGGSVR